jgi:isoleucyl-tRNA synthetase
LRYLLGNIDDFDPDKNGITYDKMFEIDRWAMQQLQKLIAEVTEAYESFAFHKVFSLIYNFCTVDMSAIYIDLMKDRMYCDSADSLSRRSGQTVMYKTLDCLVRMLAPVLVHTCEEAWAAIKFKSQNAESIHLAEMPKTDKSIDWKSQEAKWNKIMELRNKVLVALEGLRQEQKIGSNQVASITIQSKDEELIAVLNKFGLEQFAALCIASEVKLERYDSETTVVAEKSSHQKCQRCWNYWPSVGTNKEHPDLCKRCVEVMSKIT